MLPYRSPLKLRACHAACNSVVILTAAYSVFFAASLRFVALARLCRNCLIESGLLQLGSAHCTSFSRKKSTGCPCFCSPAGRCGLQAVMLFAPTLGIPPHRQSLIPSQRSKGKKSRQPLCSSVPFRAFVEDQITKALHSTSHIASPRSSYLTAFRSGPLAPLADGSQASVRSSLRLAWPFVHYAALHSLRPAVLVFLRSRTKFNFHS